MQRGQWAAALCLMVAGLLAGGVACAADKAYEIKLTRPDKTGDRYHLSATYKQKTSIVVGGEAVDPPMKEDSATDLAFEGTVGILQADEHGVSSKRSYTVDKCLSDGKPLVAAGVVIIAEVKDGPFVFTINGAAADGATTDLLRKVLDLNDPRNAPDDDAYGVKTPQKVGDSWGINMDVVGPAMAAQGLPADKDHIKGAGKLVSVKTEGGKELLHLDAALQMSVANVDSPAGGKIESMDLTSDISGEFPADVTARICLRTEVIHLSLHITGEDFDHKKTDTRTTQDTTHKVTITPATEN